MHVNPRCPGVTFQPCQPRRGARPFLYVSPGRRSNDLIDISSSSRFRYSVKKFRSMPPQPDPLGVTPPFGRPPTLAARIGSPIPLSLRLLSLLFNVLGIAPRPPFDLPPLPELGSPLPSPGALSASCSSWSPAPLRPSLLDSDILEWAMGLVTGIVQISWDLTRSFDVLRQSCVVCGCCLFFLFRSFASLVFLILHRPFLGPRISFNFSRWLPLSYSCTV